LLQLVITADVPKTPLRAALNRGVSCAFFRQVRRRKSLDGLLLADAMERAGKKHMHLSSALQQALLQSLYSHRVVACSSSSGLT
jgi:hypothetical protein